MALIKKTIFADMVREKFDGKVKMLQLAQDLGNLEGMGEGEKISFPSWNLVGDATELVKGEQINLEELQQSESFATIKQVAKGVTVYDSSNLTSIGNQLEFGASATAEVVARKIDADLIEVVKNAPLQSNCADKTAITSAEIEQALLNFGENRDIEDFAGIVVNSLLIPSFYAMPEFTDATNSATMAGNGLIHNGILGYFRGIPIIISDKGTFDNTNAECITSIVKKGALGYKFAKDIDVEIERDASRKRNNIYTDALFAVALINESGVVVIKSSNV